MDLFKTIADQLEGLAQALLECRVQFLVDRTPHVFQFAGVIGLDCGQPGFDGNFEMLKALVETQRNPAQFAGKGIQPLGLQRAELSDLRRHRPAEQIGRLRPLLAVTKRFFRILAAPARQFLTQLTLQPGQPLLLRLAQRQQCLTVIAPPAL